MKSSDGTADFKPIAHLYATQAYQLATFLQILAELQRQPTTTDTYSLWQSQEEFHFSLPLRHMDLCLWGAINSMPAENIVRTSGRSAEQMGRIYGRIESMRKAARSLHSVPLLSDSLSGAV